MNVISRLASFSAAQEPQSENEAHPESGMLTLGHSAGGEHDV